MQRFLPLTCLLLAFPACSSDPESPTGTGGAAGTGGGAGTSSGAGTGGGAGTSSVAGTGGGAGTSSGAGTGGGAGTAGTSSTAETDFPTDTSAEGIKAFLDALDHRSATWASTMTGASPPVDASSPHGTIQIWYNKALRTSHAAGHSGATTDPTSMVVKELYTGSNVVGYAAMLRTTDPKWLYYCTSTEADRCYGGAPANTAVYSTMVTNCACHGAGTIITEDAIPLP